MGQIVIDIPNRKSRRYLMSDKTQADDLIKLLDDSAVGVPTGSDSVSSEAREDAKDLEDVRKAIAEFRRTSKTYKWEDVKAEIAS